MRPERIVSKIAMSRFQAASPDKLRGGYYTSPVIAQALCNWAVRKPSDTVLEPSCGDGVFAEAVIKRLSVLGQLGPSVRSQIQGIEVSFPEANKARARVESLIGGDSGDSIECDDYFEWYLQNCERMYDCVVGNPPFVRYQNFPEPSRTQAMRALEFLGLKANRLTNIWVPFVAAATSQLKPGGRLAMVIPAELLQVSYASQLREFLISQFDSIDLLACNEMLFEDAEQEVVLLLADGKTQKSKGDHSCRIDLVEERNISDLLAHTKTTQGKNGDAKIVHHDREKWLKYFLTKEEITLMRELRSLEEVGTLGSHATVDVGVVTGKNEFFVLSKDQIHYHGLKKYAAPLVGRSSQLRGANLSKKDWSSLAEAGERVYLFHLDHSVNGTLSTKAKRYIEEGQAKSLHTNYKCSIREPWYSVPSVWVPDCFLFRQIYDFPRMVKNTAKATSTDTIHRVRCKGSSERLVRNAYTSLTAASAEIEGRSYGGGVLELEPSEAERLLFPKQVHEALPLKDIDIFIRAGRLGALLDENDRLVLKDGLGFSGKECTMLRDIWQKMRTRRQMRRRSPRVETASSGELFPDVAVNALV